MKFAPRFLVHALRRGAQALRPLQRWLSAWLPSPPPVLVPVPIRPRRHFGDRVERRRHRGT